MSWSTKIFLKAIALTLSVAVTVAVIYYGYLILENFLAFLYTPVEYLLRQTDKLSKLIQENVNNKKMHQMLKKDGNLFAPFSKDPLR